MTERQRACFGLVHFELEEKSPLGKNEKEKKELEILAIYIHIAWFSLSVHSIPLYVVLYFHQLIIRLFLRHVFT